MGSGGTDASCTCTISLSNLPSPHCPCDALDCSISWFVRFCNERDSTSAVQYREMLLQSSVFRMHCSETSSEWNAYRLGCTSARLISVVRVLPPSPNFLADYAQLTWFPGKTKPHFLSEKIRCLFLFKKKIHVATVNFTVFCRNVDQPSLRG